MFIEYIVYARHYVKSGKRRGNVAGAAVEACGYGEKGAALALPG